MKHSDGKPIGAPMSALTAKGAGVVKNDRGPGCQSARKLARTKRLIDRERARRLEGHRDAPRLRRPS